MGCGGSKGDSSGGGETEIEFDNTSVYDVDRFFDKVKNLMDSYKEATKPYEDALTELEDATEFYKVPGASKIFKCCSNNLLVGVVHIGKGMIYGLVSMSNVIDSNS